MSLEEVGKSKGLEYWNGVLNCSDSEIPLYTLILKTIVLWFIPHLIHFSPLGV